MHPSSARPDSLPAETLSDAVARSVLITQLLCWLGYPASGPTRHVHAPWLRNPETTLGRERVGARLAPDYLFVADDVPIWILDARAGAGSLADAERHRELYAYATHPEVAVKWYAICDGTELALYDVDDVAPTAKLRVRLADTSRRWPELQRVLGPRGNVSGRAAAPSDLGRHLSRLGLLRDRSFHLTNVALASPLIHLSSDGERFVLPLGLDLGDRRTIACLELDGPTLDELLAPGASFSAAALARSLAAGGRGQVVPYVGRVSLEVRVGDVPDPRGRVVPLRVERVLR
jgi:hypothetical protein